MSQGWVKLHREIMDHWIWQKDPIDFRAAWLELIMMVNHAPGKATAGSNVIDVKPGQKWTSEVKLADHWHWNVKRVRRFLKMLQSDGMIFYETSSFGTMITVVNYGVYQDFSEKTGQRSGQRWDSDQDNGKDNDRDTNKNDIRMNKNEKNINRGGDWQ